MSNEPPRNDPQSQAVTRTGRYRGQNIHLEDRRETNFESENQDNASSAKSWPWNPSKDILIAVMGMTGAGKSTFISTVTGKPVKIGHGLQACTQDIEIVSTKIGSNVVKFIDTPGFDDTDRTDADILETIAEYLKLSKNHDVRLTGILYLHRITDQRVGRTAMKNLRMFRKLVGQDNFGNVVLVTTMWNKVNHQEGMRRFDELTGTGKFWGGMIAAHATAVGYDGTQDSALGIVETIMENSPVVLQIQAELRRYGNLGQTSAGKEVMDSLKALQAQHEKEIADMRDLVRIASEEKNKELLKELQLHYDQLIEELKAANDAQAKLNEKIVEEMSGRIKELEGRWCVIC